jgi:hypothetical protein
VSAHVVDWVTASPLWSQALALDAEGARRGAMRRPALLRFNSDRFMDDVARLLAHEPADLAGVVAVPETHRLPSPGQKEPPQPTRLKLFQPVHGNFYLVAATLVCRMPGLPEHEIDAAHGERAAFVLRRCDAQPGREWAWVVDPAAPDGRSWQPLDGDETAGVAGDEDLLPLFPLRFQDGERRRRLYVGLIPTASADTFKAAGPLSPLQVDPNAAGGPPQDPRPAALKAKVTDPLRALVAAATDPPADAPADQQAKIRAAMAARLVDASRFLLLDFAELLHDTFGWFADDGSQSRPTDPKQAALWDTLAAPAVAGGTKAWRDALVTTWGERLVLMGDREGALSAGLNLHTPGLTAGALDTAVAAAWAGTGPAPDDGRATSIQGDRVEPPPVPKLQVGGGTRYALRCVYRRPQCKPPHPDVVSEASEPFEIAGFFDLDAPSRSITIAMPVGTDIRDLRKVRKSVSLLLSKQLREQMNQVTSLKDALDGKYASGETVDLGLICSFSIPIITICALLLLMIFISLLNIVFWWMPFLRICFPIPLAKDD